MLLCGCSHGNLADPNALAAVLRFKAAYKPDFTAHLGDFLDTAAFRSGARGTEDESEPIQPDLVSGLVFLDKLAPNVILCGNHEARLYRLQHHSNAIVSKCAGDIIASIEAQARQSRAKLIPYSFKACYEFANVRLMHGEFYNENAIRDHAEAYAPQGGIVVTAHTHRAGHARGRRVDNPLGLNVGTLASVPCMEYAAHRRSTMSWSAGFVWGVHNGKTAQLWLQDNGQDRVWRLPS